MKRRDFLRQAALATVGYAGLSGPIRMAGAAVLPPDPFYANAFPDLDDKQVGLDSYLGKPLVLNFWATWCPPCVKEMPDLDALHQKHTQVQFVGLAVDTAVNVRKFGEKVRVSYPLLIAGHGGIKLMRDLGNKNGGLPFTVIFDKDGRISRQILGQVKPEELERYLGELA
ncbi:MAG: TlpA disulfide reductase family protein [Burkholderiaceae bacterium]